ncbi:MAG: TetR family transcriptional regulator C-terminal domain-containing protein [Blastocatellia bacterium]|nr:TetR family transcriptional regulator C-terminal domain-containing protein [Blastocatellia bacterium]
MRKTRTKQNEKQDKKRELLQAAYQEVAERGFAQVTLEKIAERAKVSKGITIYYFESKETLLRELFQMLVKELLDKMKAKIILTEDPIERLNAIIDTFFSCANQSRAFYATYLDLASFAVRNESFKPISAAFYHGCSSIEREVISYGIEKGIFSVADIDRAIVTFQALLDGLMLRWLSEPDPMFAFPLYRESCRKQALTIVGVETD